MAERSRRRQIFVINRRWSVGLVLSVLTVVAAIIGIALVRADQVPRAWTYVFLVLALVGALSAMLMTMARNKAGDDADEAI